MQHILGFCFLGFWFYGFDFRVEFSDLDLDPWLSRFRIKYIY
jgi:hypothetical protein